WIPCYVGLLRVAEGRIQLFNGNDGLPPLEITAVGEDPSGDLWIGTRGAGAFRLARDGATTYNRAHGLANERIMSIFPFDDRTVCATNRKALSRFDPVRGRFVSFGPEEGFDRAAPTAFAEDRGGNIWMGLYTGGLVRLTPAGRFEHIVDHVPPGFVRDLKIDSKGRLWIAATGGVARLDDPTRSAGALAMRRYTRREGLAAESGYCIVELPDGRVAVGSQRGLDILEEASGSGIRLTTGG